MSESTKNEQLELAIRSGFPVINVRTFESLRALSVISDVAKVCKKTVLEVEFKETFTRDKLTAMAKSFEAKNKPSGQHGVLVDLCFFDRLRYNPEFLPNLRNNIPMMESLGINYVIVGRDSLPEEYVYHCDLPTMSDSEVQKLLDDAIESVDGTKNLFSAEETKALLNQSRGLSHNQMKNVFTATACLRKQKRPYEGELRRVKSEILREVGLDVMEPAKIEQVGGLENLKAFLATRKAGWDSDLPVKGILLAGVPGAGKTLSAKAAAGVFGTSLVRMDAGGFYNKFLGESDKLFKRALDTIEQIAPVVVLIDEIEKVFSNSDGEHEVSRRLLGKFLIWLQERKGKVFIVATANQIGMLPPELMRAGRWDRTFFVDLPNKSERTTIFNIHLSKSGHDPVKFNLADLADSAEGYTGAEIEQAVIDAQYNAVAEGSLVDHATLVRALKQISPTSVTRKADIDRIRQLRDQGFYPASADDSVVGLPTAGVRRLQIASASKE